MNNDFEPVVGRKFQFRADPMPNWNGIVDCEVLIVDPLRRLSYSWGVGGGECGLQWVVLLTLTPAEGGTHVRMEQSGFRPDQQAAYQGANYGWQKFFGGLERMLGEIAMTTKARNITYWTTTVLVAFFIGSGGCCAVGASAEQRRGRGHRLATRCTFSHPGVLEGAWSHCHTRAAFSAAQGMGVCRHLLRSDRRGRIRRCGRRLWRLWLSRCRAARHCWSYCGIVGASAGEPCHRRPLLLEKRRDRYRHERSEHCLNPRSFIE